MLGCARSQMSTATTENESQRAAVLDGARIAADIQREVAIEVARLKREHDITPYLAVVRVGDDPASAVYVHNKIRASEALGIRSEHHALAAETTTAQLLELIEQLNNRDAVDGILVQLPLPRDVDEAQVISTIAPAKD